MVVIRIPAENEEGETAWPAKFPRTELDIKKQALGDLRYAQQYLINPIALSGTELDIDWLHLYDHDDYNTEGQEFFFGVDPSISGKGDYLVICVLSKAKGSNKMYIEDFIREKANLERTITLVELAAKIYPPSVVNVEAIAAQALLVQDRGCIIEA